MERADEQKGRVGATTPSPPQSMAFYCAATHSCRGMINYTYVTSPLLTYFRTFTHPMQASLRIHQIIVCNHWTWRLHVRNVLKNEISFAFLKSFTYRQQHCQNDPHSHRSAKITKMLLYACQTSSWRCDVIMKLYISVPALKNEQIICIHMTAPFSQFCIFAVYTVILISKVCIF